MHAYKGGEEVCKGQHTVTLKLDQSSSKQASTCMTHVPHTNMIGTDDLMVCWGMNGSRCVYLQLK
jgi:hypothetical protein